MDRSWANKLKNEFSKEYFINLMKFIDVEYDSKTCFPPYSMIYKAFDKCSFEDVKVVILGQDPYHGANQAHGLCFSVPNETPIPPSLRNIFKEINEQIGIDKPRNGNLTRWSDQGILLLNSVLTVEESKPGSHQKKGWEQFTDAIIHKLNNERENLVYILWGSPAQKKGRIINRSRNLVLESPHPSPLSSYRGFFGNLHFIKCNEYLKNNNSSEIQW